MNMQGTNEVNALQKGMYGIYKKNETPQADTKKEIAQVSVPESTVSLTPQAKLEQLWEGLDPENKIRGRFKKFEITPDGKYEIETKKDSKTISDPSSKTSASTFKKMGKNYEVGAE